MLANRTPASLPRMIRQSFDGSSSSCVDFCGETNADSQPQPALRVAEASASIASAKMIARSCVGGYTTLPKLAFWYSNRKWRVELMFLIMFTMFVCPSDLHCFSLLFLIMWFLWGFTLANIFRPIDRRTFTRMMSRKMPSQRYREAKRLQDASCWSSTSPSTPAPIAA